MREYESLIAERKRTLFSRIPLTATVVDLGIGTGPNLVYMPPGCHIVGVEPNEYMWSYAETKAKALRLDLELLNARAEQLPIRDSSCDVCISTLTLCSVRDPAAVVREIVRVLRPGGLYIFLEHVIAPTSQPLLRLSQTALNPVQIALADGCHLTRDTEDVIRRAGGASFDAVAVEQFDASFGGIEDSVSFIRPHIAGYAQKAR